MNNKTEPGRPLPELPMHGGCQCDQLRYRITKPPITLYCCHCSECQAQSSSAFGMSLRIPADGMEMVGDHASWIRDPDNAREVECVFCPVCGTRIAHRGRGTDGSSSIKAGTLDIRDWLHPVGHIWAASAQKWSPLDGLVYRKQPADGYAALAAAFRQRFGFD